MASDEDAAGANEDPGVWYTVCILHVNLYLVQNKQNPTNQACAMSVTSWKSTDIEVNNHPALKVESNSEARKGCSRALAAARLYHIHEVTPLTRRRNALNTQIKG